MGVNKVLLFVNLIDGRVQMAIGLKLEDDNGVNGVTEDWLEVERVCWRLDKESSRPLPAATRPTNSQTRMTHDDTPSQQGVGMQQG